MVDNVAITPGTGATVAADEIGGVLHQRVKVSIGADGTAADWPVGSGVQAAVPRVTLATDSPGVTALSQAAKAASLPVAIASDQWYETTKVSVTFNRPANVTAYTANDAVNDNATAGGGSSTELSWIVAAGRGSLRRVRVKKTDQTVATPTLRIWFYDTVFVSGAGDNEAFVQPATDAVGFVDVAVTTAGTDDAVGWANCDIPFTGTTLYGQIQTLSAFTPASGETFTVDLWYQPG